MYRLKEALIPEVHPDPNTPAKHEMCLLFGDMFQRLFSSQKQDASGYMQRFTVAFCFVCVHTSLALTTHKPLLPMWFLYTQLAQLPPARATTHQQMGAFQSCRGTCCSLQIHGAEHYFLCL